MKLYGGKNHRITLEYARQLTQNFKDLNQDGITIGGLFDKESVMDVLNQPGCVALRYYNGINEEDKTVLVILGVDQRGHDILNGIIIERAFPCPPYCGEINSLIDQEHKEKNVVI